MKRAGLPLLVLLMLFMLSGCWNRIELNELSVVMGTAVDVEGDHWATSFQVVVPQSIATQTGGGGAASQAPVSIFTTKGDTLGEAIQRISLESSRTPFFAHNRILIISEKAAREKGVSQIIDFYLRDGETRETVDIVLSKGNAKHILEVLNPQEKIPAHAIDRIFYETEKQLSVSRRIKLSEFAAMLATPSTSAHAPEIRYTGEQDKNLTVDQLKHLRQPGVLKIGDVGVFRQDKLVGWINREESVGIAWLTDHIENSVIPFPCPDQENKGQTSTFRVERSKTKITPSFPGQTIQVKAKIDVRGTLNETGCNMKISKPDSIALLEQQIKNQIQHEIMLTWKKAQALKVDIFNFGENIHIRSSGKWRQLESTWYDKIPEIQLITDIRVKVTRTGMINDSFSNIVRE